MVGPILCGEVITTITQTELPTMILDASPDSNMNVFVCWSLIYGCRRVLFDGCQRFIPPVRSIA
jgi:hypothetical protein